MLLKLKQPENLEKYLSKAQDAVNSYHPGHWKLLLDLEQKAKEIINSRDEGEAIQFFADVAFMKQPYSINIERLKTIFATKKQEIRECLEALSRIDILDYKVMERVARIPYFGIHGGRSFTSAVLRLAYPDKFAIIDWRNLAVISGAFGFDNLFESAYNFKGLSKEDILREKGELSYTEDLYITYNEVVRDIASFYNKKASEIDLIIWTYSIIANPFPVIDREITIFNAIYKKNIGTRLRSLPENKWKTSLDNLVEEYLEKMKEFNCLSKLIVSKELVSIFTLIRNECYEYYNEMKQKINYDYRTHLISIINDLNDFINRKDDVYLLSKWKEWEDKLNTNSPNYIGIDLPATMFMKGYIIFEDLIPIRKYYSDRYEESSLDPVKIEQLL